MAVQQLPLSAQPLRRSFHAARRRLWLQRGTRTLAASVCIALGFAFTAAVLSLFQGPDPARTALWAAAALMPAAGLVAAVLQRPSESRAVRLLDLQLGLGQQLGTARELLAGRAEGRLVRWQLARASSLAEEAAVSKAFPLLPGRELRLAFVLAASTAGCLALASLGVTLPNPFSAIRLPGMAWEAPRAADRPLFNRQQAASDSARTRSPALDTTRQLLSEVQNQAQRGALSRQAAASAVQQANAELDKAAQASRIQQEALDNLAANLRGTSAGADIAQSLRQGDYPKAAGQIRDLGRQFDQMSPAARQQLTQALNSASAQSQGAQGLARAESRAAQAIEQAEPVRDNRSVERLAREVEDAGSRVVPQGELAEAWQQLDMLNRELSDMMAGATQPLSTPQVAAGPEGSRERSNDLQQSQGTGSQPGQGDPQVAMAGGLSASDLMAASGGSPGNTRGGPAEGDANPRLGPDGKPDSLQGRISDRFSDRPDAGAAPPSITREGEGGSTSTGADQLSGASAAPAENVFVPGNRRSIVRDYFSEGAGSQ